ncbi:MAG: glycine dehydrogenase (aminomethyl-transferring) [Gammaproteobacteria bacterium RIFCSPHIGHO2_12_FULL_45_9]|nr:MAG: glycine dehydrogenase (aminomethyl-transferring) [Gammaproteobacteria bacterium RIFCSPHIGHO2_12_FULL_45_9]
MPFVPHTATDCERLLSSLSLPDVNAVFAEIPASLPTVDLSTVLPAGQTELAVWQALSARVQSEIPLCFLGAGAYPHYQPAAIAQLLSRGEFYTAYTPYQAEASQGTLQLIYEYQTLMANLMGHDVSNASLYDGASAVAEAVLMAARVRHAAERDTILVPTSLHPHYRAVLRTLLSARGFQCVEWPHDAKTGTVLLTGLPAIEESRLLACVLPQPNFFGQLEAMDEITNWVHTTDACMIAVVNPLTLGILKPPGQWGDTGADIACGDAQPLGLPVSFGGPYLGFLTTWQQHVRQMPGRLVGRTQDRSGKPGFVLTLQAREQHIRRAKATSNICTNQGLMVVAATLYLALLGPQGLQEVAASCYARMRDFLAMLKTIPGVSEAFVGAHFHECVIRIDGSVTAVVRAMQAEGIMPGLPLGDYYPELSQMVLVCLTETKTVEAIARYGQALTRALEVAHV